MDTNHLNAVLDFVEGLENVEITVNQLFDLQDFIRQQDTRINILQFELELKNELICKLSDDVLQLLSSNDKSDL